MLYKQLTDINDADIPRLLSVYNTPEVSRYISISEEEKYWSYVTATPNVYFYKIYDGENLVAAMQCDFSGNVLYLAVTVFPEYQRKGIGTAVLKDIQNGKLLDFERIEVSIDKTNIASIRLFEKMNFRFVSKDGGLLNYIFIKNNEDKAMKNLTTDQIINAEFKISSNPVIKPWGGSFVAADPSLLTPDISHDGKWHMFFHTTFGVYHFTSDDGISFGKVKKIANRAMRPNINYIGGKYYLFYERTRPLIMNALNVINAVKWHSEIYVTESTDLISWSKPKPVITNTRNFEKSDRGTAISNPFLLRENGINRLYYSCGMTFIKDCGFCEPTYINYAESTDIASGYVSSEKPIISPDKKDPYLNLCSGCLKVYKLADGYIGIQNGIYERNGKSHSAIILLTSDDGLSFEFNKVLVEPAVVDGKDWMKQFVYASHLVKHGNTLRLYFNARDTSDMLKGRECIGYAEAEIKDDLSN